MSALTWWLVWLGLGVAYLPLTGRLFGSLADGGWAFSRITGLALGGYLTWLAAALGDVPIARASALVGCSLPALAAWTLGGTGVARRTWARHRRVVLLEEAAFAGVFAAFALLRALRPELADLEKPMDYGFAAAIARSAAIPPPDMWFAGESINYYYYGHYTLAFLSHLSGVGLPVAYNLMIATLPALCFVQGFSVAASFAAALSGWRFRRAALVGALSATLLVFGSNLHGFVFGVALPLADTAGLLSGEFRSEAQLDAGHYWHADATRYVGHNPPTGDKLIHEFPFYSFLVADLHAHVSDLPVVLAILGLLLAAGLRARPPPAIPRLASATAVGFAIGLAQMTNGWDLPIYAVVVAAAIAALGVGDAPRLPVAAARVGAQLAVVAASAWLVALPFRAHFERHYGELAAAGQHTPISQLAVLWAVPVAVAGAAAFSLLTRARKRKGPLAARLSGPELLWLVLFVCGMGLIALPELVVVRDIYSESHRRANTYFKLTYQAFVLLSLLAGPAVALLVSTAGSRRGAWRRGLLCAALLLPLLVYLPLALHSQFGPPSQWWPRGLDGLAFLGEGSSGDGDAVGWLGSHAPPGAVLLEADGESYTRAGRLSMATGIPTVLGWRVHEWLWRGGRRAVNHRAGEVRVVYEFPHLPAARDVLRRHRVRYLVVGGVERERFPGLAEGALRSLGAVVFESGDLVIVDVGGADPAPEGQRGR